MSILLFARFNRLSVHILIFRVALHALCVAEKDQPLAIGRGVRKPVVEVVAREMLLLAAVGLIRQICIWPVRSELK